MLTVIKQLDLNKKYTYADYLAWQFDKIVELIKVQDQGYKTCLVGKWQLQSTDPPAIPENFR